MLRGSLGTVLYFRLSIEKVPVTYFRRTSLRIPNDSSKIITCSTPFGKAERDSLRFLLLAGGDLLLGFA